MTPGPWRFAAASALGSSHAKLGTPCQDAHACEVLLSPAGGPLLVAVVADGAGSAARSGEGARLACARMLMEARAFHAGGGAVAALSQETVREWLARFRGEIAALAQPEGLAPRDFACTLLVALVGDDGAAFFQIGDGAMVVSDLDGANSEGAGSGYAWIFWPDNGEYENLTYFATDPQALDHLRFDTCDRGIDEIALFSDGLQRLALHYQTRTAHGPFFRSLFATVRASGGESPGPLSAGLAAYLSSPPVNERTDDDKTLILATRRSAPPPSPPASLAEPDPLR